MMMMMMMDYEIKAKRQVRMMLIRRISYLEASFRETIMMLFSFFFLIFNLLLLLTYHHRDGVLRIRSRWNNATRYYEMTSTSTSLRDVRGK